MKTFQMQPLNGLGESACEEIQKEMEESASSTDPWIEQVTNSLRNSPSWLPWAIGAGALILISRRRK